MGVDLGLSGFEMAFRFRLAGGKARTDYSEREVDRYTNDRTDGDDGNNKKLTHRNSLTIAR